MAEPAPAPSAEAVTRVVASKEQEAPRPGAVLTRTQELANGMRKSLVEKGEDETLQGTISRVPKRGEIKALVDENHGTKIDPKTGEKIRTGTEQVEFDDVIKSVDNLFQYLETGKLNRTDEAQVRADIEEIFRMYPGGENLVTELGNGVITDTVLNDPDFRKALQDRLIEIKANRVAEINPGAETALNEAKRAEKAKERERDRIKGESDAINAGLKEFSTTRGTVGKRRQELDTLISNMTQLKIDADRARQQLRSIDSQISRYERQVDAIMNGTLNANNNAQLLTTAQSEITRLEGERQSRQDKIDEHTVAESNKAKLEQDKADLEQRKKEVAPDLENSDGELDALREARINAETALARATKARSVQEGEFLSSIDDVYKDAAVKYYDDKVKAAEAAQQVILDKELGEAKNDMDRKVLEEIGGKRWKIEDAKARSGMLHRKNKNVVTPNVPLIDADYKKMLLEGPNETLKGILTGMGVQPDQMSEMLADPKYRDLMVKQILVNRMDTSKITRNEARAIATSEWGNKAIETAIAGNADANNAVNNLKANGLLRGHTPAEWISEHPGSTLAAILLMLLTPAAGFGVAALAGAGPLGLIGGAAGGEALGLTAIGSGAGINKIGKMPL